MKHLLAILLLAAPPILYADDFVTQRDEVLALGKLTASPPMKPAAGYTGENGMTAIYYKALPWQGKPTEVFAWLGLPKTHVGKMPGIVLVHGGGGTAFKEWVKLWNDRGFAAISIAVEGQTNRRLLKGATTESNPKGWEHHAWGGPARVGIYGDSNETLTNQWMYHAVADTILANSLLRSLPDVNADKVGIMGISWGGVITSTVIGIDPRFAFAIPTYGCGHLFDAANQYGRALGTNELYRQVWDPMVRMNRVKLPVLWFSWPQDQHFPMDCLAACYRAAPGPHMVTLIPGMKHGHGAGWRPPDSYAFAKSVVREGKPWCQQTSAGMADQVAHIEFICSKPLDRALLVSTTGIGVTGDRKWIESPAVLEQSGNVWRCAAPLPEGTTAWFINVRSGKLIASSDYQEKR